MATVTLLKSKIHRATVTAADLHYEGSISICPKLMQTANIYEYEKVTILNIENGNRFDTYAIKSENKGEIKINGAAARLTQPGDHVIILTYINEEDDKAMFHKPTIVLVNSKNQAKKERKDEFEVVI